MNGQPPEYGSDDMLALAAYHQWLASGVPIYQPGNTLYGRGYSTTPEPELKPDAIRGKAIYQAKCALCHAEDGEGTKVATRLCFHRFGAMVRTTGARAWQGCLLWLHLFKIICRWANLAP